MIAFAPSFPACTASTTSLPPFTASPPAKTPAILVAAFSFTTIFPLLFSSLLRFTNSAKGICPAALITISTSSVKVLPVSTGERRPLASGSPNAITLQTSCSTFPLPFISFGAASQIISQPSSMAISSSTWVQGISSCVRLYSMVTSFAPRRLACVAASIAVMPIPITATLSPTGIAG